MRVSRTRLLIRRVAHVAHTRPGGVRATLMLLMVSLPMSLVIAGCGASGDGAIEGESPPVVLADTSFLADIAQNVAGPRMEVSALLPLDTDPHSFQPTPQDAKRIAESRAVIINVVGLEPQLDDLLADVAGPDVTVIEAAEGLVGTSEDPHVWLDPILVTTYVDNIARGLAEVDPAGAEKYRANAQAYIQELHALDAWIAEQVATIPVDRRLLVTNHESLNYFAGRYGFTVVGTVFPTVSGEGAPSAQQIAALVGRIRSTGAPAIFLETGSNAELALQIAAETGVKVVTDVSIASLTEAATTYLDMMRRNVELIVEALR